ncbi:MAG: hypothetical protein QOF70_2656 [Acetobacteraceae bacterium]|jgi:hypothetical protein|nr:hypothetical protein [Acetobacteraceae bacterium]
MKNKPGGGDQQGGKPSQPPGERKIARGLLSLGNAFFDKYKSDTAKDDRSRQIDSNWIRHGAKAAVAYTAITFVLMIVGGYQVYISRDTERRQLRAYVAVSDFSVLCCAVDIERSGYQERKKFAKIIVKNGGITPASSVRVSVGAVEYQRGLPFPSNISYGTMSTSGKVTVAPNGESIVTPASYYILQGSTETFQAAINTLQMMRTKNGLSNTIVFGTISYIDVFGQKNDVDFCRIWEVYADDTDGYPDCPEHNNATGE